VKEWRRENREGPAGDYVRGSDDADEADAGIDQPGAAGTDYHVNGVHGG